MPIVITINKFIIPSNPNIENVVFVNNLPFCSCCLLNIAKNIIITCANKNIDDNIEKLE